MPYKLTYTTDEINTIKESINIGHQSWSHDNLKSIKDKIKDFNIIKTSHRCCYCGISIHAAHRMTIDIEHILPKAKLNFVHYMFSTKNLSVACKRCNMRIKGQRIDFLTNDFNRNHIFRSNYYKFIHPHLDNYDAHLFLLVNQAGREMIFKYLKFSEKGQYTYDYFKLEEIELNSFDLAQGGKKRNFIKNPEINNLYQQLATN